MPCSRPRRRDRLRVRIFWPPCKNNRHRDYPDQSKRREIASARKHRPMGIFMEIACARRKGQLGGHLRGEAQSGNGQEVRRDHEKNIENDHENDIDGGKNFFSFRGERPPKVADHLSGDEKKQVVKSALLMGFPSDTCRESKKESRRHENGKKSDPVVPTFSQYHQTSRHEIKENLKKCENNEPRIMKDGVGAQSVGMIPRDEKPEPKRKKNKIGKNL